MHDIERFIGVFQRFQRQYFKEQPGLPSPLREGQKPGTLLTAPVFVPMPHSGVASGSSSAAVPAVSTDAEDCILG